MKFNDLGLNSTEDKPSELIQELLMADKQMIPLEKWLREFDFTSQEEIYDAVKRTIHHASTTDLYMTNKDKLKRDPTADVIHKRFYNLRVSAHKEEDFSESISATVWTEYFAPKIREEKIAKLFGSAPNKKEFRKACDRLRTVYNFSELDVEKLRFFVEMVKAGRSFPNSLRRMLYIWSKEKKTGKSTTAYMITSLLNGDEDYNAGMSKYKSDLNTEMQIKPYSLPKIAQYRCVYMDECFYTDMGKTYNTFKAMITSADGTARMPYGQEFKWYGLPNYIATSNEPLETFVKDWNDRRYLELHFGGKPTENLSFDEIFALWRSFVLNSYMPEDETFESWSYKLEDSCETIGERAVYSEDFATIFRQSPFLQWIQSLTFTSRTSNDGKVTLTTIESKVSEYTGQISRGKRKEVEDAFVKVFGDRGYSGGWYAADLQVVASKLQFENSTTSYEPKVPF